MQGEWKVSSNSINGQTMYAVYRIKDTSAVDHSGNREFGSYYSEDRQRVDALAEKLNQEEDLSIRRSRR